MSTNNRRIKLASAPAEAGISLVLALNELRKPSAQPGGLDRVSLDGGEHWTYSVSDPKGKDRILELIGLILEYEGIAREYRNPKLNWRTELLWCPPKRSLSIHEKLNMMLSGYKSSPGVRATIRTGTLEWGLENTGRRTNGEMQMAEWVIELSKSGFLDRVRRCLCGRWFFARRSDSSTCSGKCRKDQYENTAARVEKRRKNARRYYWLHKSGKVK